MTKAARKFTGAGAGTRVSYYLAYSAARANGTARGAAVAHGRYGPRKGFEAGTNGAVAAYGARTDFDPLTAPARVALRRARWLRANPDFCVGRNPRPVSARALTYLPYLDYAAGDFEGGYPALADAEGVPTGY